MGRDRIDRSANPLAAMMQEEAAELEQGQTGAAEAAGAEEPARPTPGGYGKGASAALSRRPGGRRRGRPRGGRNSDPNCVPISAKINKDVRFAMDRALAEQSEVEGRPVYMAEVIERLMRFYVERGDPYELLEG